MTCSIGNSADGKASTTQARRHRMKVAAAGGQSFANVPVINRPLEAAVTFLSQIGLAEDPETCMIRELVLTTLQKKPTGFSCDLLAEATTALGEIVQGTIPISESTSEDFRQMLRCWKRIYERVHGASSGKCC